ncbi:glutamate receptor ionotropic, kainate glr-3-like [Macrobrachium nipponense]|uniref:glutamate receptor ionotropic, kainate glr-3-like n=1 Tax=Macrobrachium nipponense TaxID=159736 RepID=UPI0030C89720
MVLDRAHKQRSYVHEDDPPGNPGRPKETSQRSLGYPNKYQSPIPWQSESPSTFTEPRVKQDEEYTVTRPPDGAWGYRYPNGTWNGMVGMLKRKEVDLAFVPFSVLYTRAQVLDYTATLMIDYGRILARKGKTEINPWGFLMPLTPGVWLCLLSSLGLVMAVSFTISSFMQKYEWPSEFSLRNYVRIFLIQDLEDKSVKDVARSILAAAWMIALVVVMESYAGNLRSLLIVRYVPQPYHRVRAVLDDPRITVLWMSGGSYQQILYSIETGDFKELANAEKSKISYLEFTNFEDKVITKVSRGDHVMMWEGLALEIILTRHYSETGTCLFCLSKERFFPLMSAMGTQKFSPLIPALNKRTPLPLGRVVYYHQTGQSNTRLLSEAGITSARTWSSPAGRGVTLDGEVQISPGSLSSLRKRFFFGKC